MILVFFGLTASGKTHLARAYAQQKKASYHNSDVVRKELANVPPTSRQPEGIGSGIYNQAMTDQVYDALLTKAAKEIDDGTRRVVLDGSYAESSRREQLNLLAERRKCQVVFVYCYCSMQETKRRLNIREHDPLAVSDGRWEVYQAQCRTFDPPQEKTGNLLIQLNTEKNTADLVQDLDRLIDKLRYPIE